MSDSMKTDHRQNLESKFATVLKKTSVADDLLLRLLFANLITSLEVYLYGVMKDLVESDQKLLLSVAKSKKFKDRKLPIHFVLASDPKRYLMQLISEINFHNLSDVEPLFREAFGIKIPLKDDILQAIRLRHDIIHRDGFSKTGNLISIDSDAIKNTADVIQDLVKAVDQQLVERYAARFSI